jgi:hypothetical protein
MAQFKGCLIHGMKRGGGGNGQRMRCEARGSGSMAATAGQRWEAAGVHPCFGAEGGRRVTWAECVNGQRGRWSAGPAGPKSEENSFLNKNWIIKYTKALEICSR